VAKVRQLQEVIDGKRGGLHNGQGYPGGGGSFMSLHEEVKQERGKRDTKEQQKATQAQPPS